MILLNNFEISKLDTHTHTHTHTHTEGQTEREIRTDRQTDRERERGRQIVIEKQINFYRLTFTDLHLKKGCLQLNILSLIKKLHSKVGIYMNGNVKLF